MNKVIRESLEASINELMKRNDITIRVTDEKTQKWNICIGEEVMSEGINGNAIMEDFDSPLEVIYTFAGMIKLYEQWKEKEAIAKKNNILASEI